MYNFRTMSKKNNNEENENAERFLALAKQVISVPKAEIDKRLAEEREAKDKAKKSKESK